MDIYTFDDYRDFLNTLCFNEKESRGFKSTLAKVAGCQSAYFSQVLRQKAHLTEDHILGIALYLGFTDPQKEYLLTLLRLAKAGTPRLKGFLLQSIERSRKQNLNLSTRAQAERTEFTDNELGQYVSTWIPSAVHLLTSSQLNSAEEIAKRLGLSMRKVRSTLGFLRRIGFVEKKGEHWVYRSGDLHIPQNSIWQPALQLSRRQLAQRSISQSAEGAIHFSSLFTIDERDFPALRKLVGDFVERSHKVIHKSGTEKLACLCLDLFEV